MGNQLSHWLAPISDHNLVTANGKFNQLGEVALGIKNAHCVSHAFNLNEIANLAK
jgi:hypothetical protein